jgi:hypothetical protein
MLRPEERDAVHWQLKPNVLARRLGSSSVLVDLDSNKIYELNQTGAWLVERLAEGLDDSALPQALADAFEGSAGSMRADVERLLDELHAAGLVSTNRA